MRKILCSRAFSNAGRQPSLFAYSGRHRSSSGVCGQHECGNVPLVIIFDQSV